MLREYELDKIVGGATVSSCVGVSLVVTAIIAFITGIIDGYTNPRRCN